MVRSNIKKVTIWRMPLLAGVSQTVANAQKTLSESGFQQKIEFNDNRVISLIICLKKYDPAQWDSVSSSRLPISVLYG